MSDSAKVKTEIKKTQGTTTVFTCYSRKDRDFVLRLADALEGRDIGVLRDVDDILPTEEWRKRIDALIGAADTVVFVISPDSVSSPECAKEISLCERLSKRIAPIVWREAD